MWKKKSEESIISLLARELGRNNTISYTAKKIRELEEMRNTLRTMSNTAEIIQGINDKIDDLYKQLRTEILSRLVDSIMKEILENT